eukprot:m.129981 g.129981  ORF g.129981 m.129981 type:complete len:167 (+) comp14762_c2_seq1:2252-2752(+)
MPGPGPEYDNVFSREDHSAEPLTPLTPLTPLNPHPLSQSHPLHSHDTASPYPDPAVARCALTGLPAADPVRAADGSVYERSAVLALLAAGVASPVTHRPFPSHDLVDLRSQESIAGSSDRLDALPRRLAGRAPADQFLVRELVLRRDRRAPTQHPHFDQQNVGEDC